MTLFLLTFVLAGVTAVGCAPDKPPGAVQPPERGLEETRQLHTQAHLEGDAELMVSTFAATMTSVQNGRVSQGSRADNLARFGGYFGSQDILVWEDMAPVDIQYSTDSSMAHVVAVKRVITREKGTQAAPDTTDFAWTELWRVQDGEWKIELTASTRVP